MLIVIGLATAGLLALVLLIVFGGDNTPDGDLTGRVTPPSPFLTRTEEEQLQVEETFNRWGKVAFDPTIPEETLEWIGDTSEAKLSEFTDEARLYTRRAGGGPPRKGM